MFLRLTYFEWAPIFILLAVSSPTTVSRLVITFVVDSIQCAPFWAFAKMNEERGKAISPFVAHGNSATTIVSVFLVGWIETARLRFAPRSIFFGFSFDAPSRLSMRFTAQAATAFGIPRAKGTYKDESLRSTITQTIYSWHSPTIGSALDYC